MKEKKGISKWVYWFSLGLALIISYNCITNFSGLYEFLRKIASITMPFLLAIIVAYLFYRPAAFIEKKISKIKILKKAARPISVFSVYIIAILLIIILVNCVVPPVRDSIADLFNNLPNYIEKAKDYVSNIEGNSIVKQINIEEAMKSIKEFNITKILDMSKIFDYINTVIGIFSVIFSAFVTIIVSIYILLERGNIKNFLKKAGQAVLDEQAYTKVSEYFKKSNWILLDFIYCQIIDGIIIGILASIAMSIIGVKYSVLLGMFIGLFNIIPYFGAIIAITVAILITLFTGGWEQALLMAAIVIILQQIDANIINPKILGEGLKISPILIIFAVTIGGEFFGVLGMFLSVPIVAIIKVLIIDFIEFKNKNKKAQQNI